MDGPQISEGVDRMDFLFVLGYQVAQTAGDHAIINVYCKDKSVSLYPGLEHPWICLTDTKTKVSERADEGIIPSSSGLFQPIQQLV